MKEHFYSNEIVSVDTITQDDLFAQTSTKPVDKIENVTPSTTKEATENKSEVLSNNVDEWLNDLK